MFAVSEQTFTNAKMTKHTFGKHDSLAALMSRELEPQSTDHIPGALITRGLEPQSMDHILGALTTRELEQQTLPEWMIPAQPLLEPFQRLPVEQETLPRRMIPARPLPEPFQQQLVVEAKSEGRRRGRNKAAPSWKKSKKIGRDLKWSKKKEKFWKEQQKLNETSETEHGEKPQEEGEEEDQEDEENEDEEDEDEEDESEDGEKKSDEEEEEEEGGDKKSKKKRKVREELEEKGKKAAVKEKDAQQIGDRIKSLTYNITKVSKKMTYLSHKGGLKRDIFHDKVIGAMNGLSTEICLNILEKLEAGAAKIEDPTGWIIRACNRCCQQKLLRCLKVHEVLTKEERSRPPTFDEQKIRTRIRWLNKNGDLSNMLCAEEIINFAVGLQERDILKILRDIQEKRKGVIQDPQMWVVRGLCNVKASNEGLKRKALKMLLEEHGVPTAEPPAKASTDLAQSPMSVVDTIPALTLIILFVGSGITFIVFQLRYRKILASRRESLLPV
eukprot:gnl/MRDRNA2_/MRDRNA2_72373_c0_seq2.p1 gnl/MRDRNA2_/MRDRNA2_72373_c0~~gnl/MRDRNA2_/MRDRNA2_72373_c0_seq2.p1  ORF type:complete len:545 (-),score=130.01 gnl/MRDRNA2_/MRDRNA2_72373_c0_seq2:196-1692(-)